MCMMEYSQRYQAPQDLIKKSDLSTTYFGKADKSKNNKIKAEESFLYQSTGILWES